MPAPPQVAEGGPGPQDAARPAAIADSTHQRREIVELGGGVRFRVGRRRRAGALLLVLLLERADVTHLRARRGGEGYGGGRLGTWPDDTDVIGCSGCGLQWSLGTACGACSGLRRVQRPLGVWRAGACRCAEYGHSLCAANRARTSGRWCVERRPQGVACGACSRQSARRMGACERSPCGRRARGSRRAASSGRCVRRSGAHNGVARGLRWAPCAMGAADTGHSRAALQRPNHPQPPAYSAPTPITLRIGGALTRQVKLGESCLEHEVVNHSTWICG